MSPKGIIVYSRNNIDLELLPQLWGKRKKAFVWDNYFVGAISKIPTIAP